MMSISKQYVCFDAGQGARCKDAYAGGAPMHFQLKQTYLTRKPPFHRLSASTRRLLANNGGEQLEYWSVRSRY